MSKEKIARINARFCLGCATDAKAWEFLQKTNAETGQSFSRIIIEALNQYAMNVDDRMGAFEKEIVSAVERGAKEALPLVMAKELLSALPFTSLVGTTSPKNPQTTQQNADDDEAAMSFMKGF